MKERKKRIESNREANATDRRNGNKTKYESEETTKTDTILNSVKQCKFIGIEKNTRININKEEIS